MDKAANFSVTGSDFKVQVSADIHFPALTTSKKNTAPITTGAPYILYTPVSQSE